MGSSGSKDSGVLRLVLVGKTGVGKSAAGNTILRKKAFKSKLSASSLTTECEKVGQNVAVIDTPGLFDTKLTQEETVERIKMCISLSSPGPHAFVICLQIGRFTKEEKDTVQLIQKIFGKEAADYTIVLFTHGDKLGKQSIESFIEENEDLLELIRKCQNRYHVFNNAIINKKQRETFLKKIKMIQSNGGGYYTNGMFKSAEEAIEKEKQRLLKESEDQRKKELEELFAKYAKDQETYKKEEHNLNERYSNEAREKAERSNEFVKENPTAIGTKITTLATGGAMLGSAIGPMGAAIGAATGAVVGAVTEVVEACPIQ